MVRPATVVFAVASFHVVLWHFFLGMALAGATWTDLLTWADSAAETPSPDAQHQLMAWSDLAMPLASSAVVSLWFWYGLLFTSYWRLRPGGRPYL